MPSAFMAAIARSEGTLLRYLSDAYRVLAKTIPFTSISLDDSYALMYLFGLLATGIGEAVVLYALGLPLQPHFTNPSFPPKDSVSDNATLKVESDGHAYVTIY